MRRLARIVAPLVALLSLGTVEPSLAGDAASLEAVVAARTIRRGETVTADALRSVAVRSLPDADFVAAPDEAVGRIAARTLVRGRLLPRAALRLPPDVEKGERLALMWRSGALTLDVPALALGAGRVGDALTVRVGATGARIAARITGPGRAEALR